MRHKLLLTVFFFLAINIEFYSQEVTYDETGCRYTSYNGLVMAGYQGWFSCPRDPINAGWFHYPKDNQVRQGYIGIDAWPDMSEYDKKYPATDFVHPDGTQAYLFSSADSSTIDLHFRWMKEYGIDGVFVQRFVSQTVGGTGKTRVNTVLKYALKAAKKYDRAIAIMYDGGISNETDYKRITSDWNEIVTNFKLFDPVENPTFLRHNGKPVFSLWGYGISNRGFDPTWFEALCENVKGETAKKVSIMIGTPYYWREQISDCVADKRYHATLEKWVDIISPWAVGRYRSNNAASRITQSITADLAWCKQRGITYVPVVFPGFSWQNLKGGENNPYDDYPREGGNFLWKQIAAAKNVGAQSLYVAMFDEMDEATCIFKCETTDRVPLNGSGTFVGYDNDLGSDYYLWLTGQATRWIRGANGYNSTKPVRVAKKEIYLSTAGSNSNDGLSVDKPVASLTKALSLVSNGDIIRVSGFINVASENTHSNGVELPNLNFSIEGVSKENSGFTGGNTSRILQILNNNNDCVLKNLTFKNAGNTSLANGMVITVINSNTQFENCDFIDNNGNIANGLGTVYLNNTTGLRMSECIFRNNKVRFGGGIYIEGGKVEITDCIFENIDLGQIANSSGAGIYISNAANVRLKNNILRNNKSVLDGTAVYLRENSQVRNLVSNIRIEDCLITGNISVNHGGAALTMYNQTAGNFIHLAVINCTVYKNGTTSVSNGGAFFFDSARRGSTVNLINCTITDNYSGGNAGHGAGIRFYSNNNDDTTCKNLIKRISNCIIEHNIAAQHPNQGSDISNRFDAVDGEDLFINNSYIGFILDNNGPYVQVPGSINRIGYQLAGLSGLSQKKDSFINIQNSIPLEFDSDVLDYGDAQYLKNFGVNTDQLGNIRNFTNNKCAIGAVEISAEPVYEGISRNYTHLIMYGQSLSTGHESHVTISPENIGGNYMIGDQIWINYGNSDMKTLNPLVGTRAKSAIDIIESPLLGTANHIQMKGLHESIIATSAGTSGKPIEDLSKESQVSNLYNDYTNTLKSAYKIARRSNSTITAPALFWLQGEWNYQGYGSGLTPGTTPTFDKNEYKNLMITLKNDMQNDVKSIYNQTNAPVFITYQCGVQYTKGKELTIGMAQLEASNEYSDVICAGPVYQMTDVGGHLDANGYRWYGEMLGKVYYKTQILGENFKPLQPLVLSRDNVDQKKVIIKFLVPKSPLVLDDKTLGKITDYGFEVYNNNARQTISNVSISGDSVILVCAQNLTGKIDVIYAGVNATYVSTSGNGRGSGNLRDSDDYQAVFTYQDLDKKDGSGKYVYPRNAGDASTTLRPAFEPKDAEGNIIYDKPYPLYNFSVSFYYSIPQGEQKYIVPNLTENGTGNSLTTLYEKNFSIKQEGKNISVVSADYTTFFAEIFEMSGRRVISIVNGITNRQVNLSHLYTGFYLIKITVGDELKTVKISI